MKECGIFEVFIEGPLFFVVAIYFYYEIGPTLMYHQNQHLVLYS